ncbi:hypothetical protein SAMN05421877_107171 [Sphingobacterium lactis]|uniref:Uncharacterized protein n=1 Tax=Sphingobacterium lactis TaxID=797291 RepID=A0A1H5ZTK1_9SPHI|nr:hypothetical protein SAMN05421877_107171 [Sphingobacterium lactis]
MQILQNNLLWYTTNTFHVKQKKRSAYTADLSFMSKKTY